MTDKFTNLTLIPLAAEWKKETIQKLNAGLENIQHRAGIQITRASVVIKRTDWKQYSENDPIPDVDDPEKTKPNPTTAPVARAFVKITVKNPKSMQVVYTDLMIAPHYADTPVFAAQIQAATASSVILVDHTKLDLLGTKDAQNVDIYLMFWAFNSIPTVDLDFDVGLM